MRIALLSLALAVAGCRVEEPVIASPPLADDAELIEVSPGVEVIADFDAPIFYADDYYWWFYGGLWYWSHWYHDGWHRAPHVPPRVVRLPNRERYTHYRPPGWVPHRPASHPGVVGIHSRPAPRGRHH